MVYVESFLPLVLCYLFVLDFQFCLCLVHGHATLYVVSYGYWFYSCLFLGLTFYVVRVLGISWEKRKFNGAHWELNETQQVM